MSDETGSGTPAPTATPAPATQAPATPPASPEPPADDNPPWLPQRLTRAADEARKAVLAELGVDDPEKAKAALEAARKAEESSKTAEQKLGETSKTLEAIKTEAERYKAATVAFAAQQMAGLTDAQKAAVKAIAGDDSAAQLNAIAALTPTWSSAPPAPAAPGAPAAPPAPVPATPPGGTAPPPTAPADNNPGSPPDHAAVYQSLQQTNPFAAAEYLSQHAREIFPES